MKTRKVLPPATGTVKWLEDDPVTGNGWLRITCGKVVQEYEVERVPGGFKLWRLDPGSYELVCRTVTHSGRCNCPDAINRPERRYACKHSRGVKVALQALPF